MIVTILLAFLGILATILVEVISRVLAEEFKAWSPTLIDKLIQCAVSRLPVDHRDRFSEEWQSHISDTPGHFSRLIVACGFWRAARAMSPPIIGHQTFIDQLKMKCNRLFERIAQLRRASRNPPRALTKAVTIVGLMAIASDRAFKEYGFEWGFDETLQTSDFHTAQGARWSPDGVFGPPNFAVVQRGFQIYTEVCANCHAMSQLHHRDLSGLELTDDEVEAIAKSIMVPGEEQKQPKADLPPRADQFRSPFPNEATARKANNSAHPPDLSLIINAQEGGANYVRGLLTGYADEVVTPALNP